VGLRNVRRRLQALDIGGPLPIYKTKLTRVATDAVLVTFVRMAGETRPWGIAFGRANKPREMQTLSVPNPRDYKDVARMVEAFGDWMLREYRVAGAYSDAPLLDLKSPEARITQLWVAGSTHLTMLHYLQYQYQRSRNSEGEPTTLGTFGRLVGWLFNRAQLKGDQWTVDASKLLNEMYEFPADDFSMKHLGAQIAWLQTEGSLSSKRDAAILAARRSVSITIDPLVENNVFAVVEKHKELNRANVGDEGFASYSASEISEISAIVESELRERWRLLAAAHDLALRDARPENLGVSEALVSDQLADFCSNFNLPESLADSGEDVFTPAASSGYSAFVSTREYLVAERAADRWLPSLIHYDDELLMEALLEGVALGGHVVKTELIAGAKEADCLWVVELSPRSAKYYKRRLQEKLSPLGSPTRTVEVVHLEHKLDEGHESGGRWFVTLKWDKANKVRMRHIELLVPHQDWVGQKVAFVPSYVEIHFLTAMKALKMARTGASAWLFGQAPVKETVDSDD
jgi:hypothetical protein